MTMVSLFTTVWTSLSTWLVTTFQSVIGLFVDSSGTTPTLTFVGVLGVIMAGISLILLCFNLIRSFLAMRG